VLTPASRQPLLDVDRALDRLASLVERHGQLEVVGRQASFAIGRGECLRRLDPVVAFEGVLPSSTR
jgi:hypothetical protein